MIAGKAMQRHSVSDGLTLIELLVILSISAALLAIAIPGFSSLIQSQRLTTSSNALFMAVNMARSEAIHRGRRVDLVPLDGRQWSNGWLVFVDENNNQRPDQDELIIHSYRANIRDLRITPRFSDSKVQYIAFNGSGRSRNNAGNQIAQSGHWLLELGPHSRKLVINFLGRPRVCNPRKAGC
ncbi:FimT type IV pilus assembly protein [Janthinobacterium sp. Marseille]|nr:FimT type IV pilus assembly protein [Janthinobacterium sp. Marseille]